MSHDSVSAHACSCLLRCGHCKRLAPEYEKAATALAADDPAIPLAKVDCPANSGQCSKFGVTGYPTLKIFRGGEFSADYSGPRSAGEPCLECVVLRGCWGLYGQS